MFFKRTDGWEMRFEVGICIHLWMTPRKMIWQDLTFWLHGQEMDSTGGLSNLCWSGDQQESLMWQRELSSVRHETKRNLIYLEGLPKVSQKQKQLNEVVENEQEPKRGDGEKVMVMVY